MKRMVMMNYIIIPKYIPYQALCTTQIINSITVDNKNSFKTKPLQLFLEQISTLPLEQRLLQIKLVLKV